MSVVSKEFSDNIEFIIKNFKEVLEENKILKKENKTLKRIYEENISLRKENKTLKDNKIVEESWKEFFEILNS
jgi:cell shape-determining protein MreC